MGGKDVAGRRVPLFDLERQNAPIAAELMSALAAVAESQSFVLGPAVTDLEMAVAEYVGSRHAVGVGSGTDALYLALSLLGLEEGDEVITTPFSFFATAGAVVKTGGRLVMADIEPATFNLDPAAVADAITDRTRAVIPVHLFGQMAELSPLLDLAAKHDLWIIEDAAQSIGARALIDDRWRSAGAVGRLGCFSFYPTKNLGGWGDGGMVTADDEELAARLRRLRVHGADLARDRYLHHEVGINSRLDAVQAAVLNVKLRHLPGWTETRRARAASYDRRLADVAGVTTPRALPDRYHVYSLYTIRAERREALRDDLAARGIGSGVYYPLPLHLQPCFERLGYRRGDFPEAERAAAEVLSLPLYPELRTEEVERVVDAIAQFYAREA